MWTNNFSVIFVCINFAFSILIYYSLVIDILNIFDRTVKIYLIKFLFEKTKIRCETREEKRSEGTPQINKLLDA